MDGREAERRNPQAQGADHDGARHCWAKRAEDPVEISAPQGCGAGTVATFRIMDTQPALSAFAFVAFNPRTRPGPGRRV